MSSFQVVLTPEAQEDLERLFLFALEKDAEFAQRVLAAIEGSYGVRWKSPTREPM